MATKNAEAEAKSLRDERDAAHKLLARLVKYAREDEMVTPGVTRMARALDEARELLGMPSAEDESSNARFRRVMTTPRPADEYHEDRGNVLWWTFPLSEPPYCGTPFDDDFPDYATHWTPLPIVSIPEGEDDDDGDASDCGEHPDDEGAS